MADEKNKSVTISQEQYSAMQTQMSNSAQQASIAQAIAVKEKTRSEELSNLVNRMQADFDNYRKRVNETSKRMKNEGVFEVIEKVLPILDVIRKAISMITDESVANGVKMIYKQFNDTLTSLGVEEIPALGKEFDPNFHNAISRVKVEDPKMNNVVVEVFQKGYMLGEKILRHSVVKVGTVE